MKFVFACISLIFFSSLSYGQQWLGIATSNYGGTNSAYLNPANIADSRFKCYINLAGANASVLNNYASWNAPYSMVSMLTGNVPAAFQNEKGAVVWKNSYLSEEIAEKNYTGFINAEVRGPSFYYTLEKHKITLGLSSRIRFSSNFSNANLDVARLIVEGTNQPNLFKIDRPDNHITANLNGMIELAANIGYIVKEDDQNFIKVGLSAKRINALTHAHIFAENVNYTLDRSPLDANQQLFYLNSSSGQYAFVDDNVLNGLGITKTLLGTIAGSGYGFDIGVVYEHRPDYEKYDYRDKGVLRMDGTQNKYKYKIGLALLDIGTVKYNDPNYISQTTVNQNFVTIVVPGTFSTFSSFNQLNKTLDRTFNINAANKTYAYTLALPMALSFNFDYNFFDRFYIATTLLHSLRSETQVGMRQPSLLAITPRYETKWLEISMPVALLNNYQNFTLGLAGRAGPFFIGSDNIGGFLNIGKPMGLDFYGGVFVPIFRTLPNNAFQCPKTAKQPIGQRIKSIFGKK